MGSSISSEPRPASRTSSSTVHAVEVEALGKRYRIAEGAGDQTLLSALGRRVRRGSPATREFWALRDVTFEVEEGEVLGVLGRNGAGKSTLLKILSRITAPSAGRARVRGRLGALLEVGTAFHLELTGRENIHINGAMLGMARADVRRRFDEIVEFAGVEAFLDTPLKHYSSGMYLRLAFSVAAHMEPDVIVIDEVLAVGDAEFQRRCLGKMSEFGREGRTVIFVSHDLGSVAHLCSRCLWLEDGDVRQDGATEPVLAAYLSTGTKPVPWLKLPRDSSARAQLTGAGVFGPAGQNGVLRRDEPLHVVFEIEVNQPVPSLDVAGWIVNRTGQRIVDERWSDWEVSQLELGSPGKHRLEMVIPPLLPPGGYLAGFWLGTELETYFYDEAISFEMQPRRGERSESVDRHRLVTPHVSWSVRSSEAGS